MGTIGAVNEPTAVIAGGALETHFRHYLDKHGITITGDGSISRYNNAVGQARKTNPGLFTVNDGKLVDEDSMIGLLPFRPAPPFFPPPRTARHTAERSLSGATC